MSEAFLSGRVILHGGDCRDVVAGLADASISAVVTDPPYALVSIGKRFGKPGAAPARHGTDGLYARASAGFMGQAWDTGETAFAAEFWAEILRVLKPGGHVVAFSGTRTYHRMVCAIEDAGFEIRDQLAWVYGSGFPKSHDVAKGIDRLDAVELRRDRQLRFTAWMRSTGLTSADIDQLTGTNMGSHYTTASSQPAVATRQHLEALRPHIKCLVPPWVEALVDERTVESENFKKRLVVRTETGKDAVGGDLYAPGVGVYIKNEYNVTVPHTHLARVWHGWGTALKPAWEPIVLARKPLAGTVAETVLAHGTGAVNIAGCRIIGAAPRGDEPDTRWPANFLHDGSPDVVCSFPGDADQAAATARFFYSAKADGGDRLGSKHPTVKPVDLMQWLCRLVTPPGGTILDPFAGTGTTGEAAWREGFSAVLVEREAAYQDDIRRRLRLADRPTERASHAKKGPRGHDDLPLFGEAS